MSTRVIARKELRRHGIATGVFFCVVVLASLAAASLLPRSWTAEGVVSIDPDPTRFAALAAELRNRLQAGARSGSPVEVLLEGNALRVRQSAPHPQLALEQLNALLARVVQDELDAVRERLRQDEQRLVAESDAAAQRVEALARQLATLQGAQAEGGESALGARIGQLQAERDALALDLRASGELRARLGARVRELESEMAALAAAPEADAAARTRIDTELKPQRAAAEARLATLRDEVAVKEKRRREIDALLESARAETHTVRQESDALRELQRQYDDAAELNRQLRQKLQELRDTMALRVTASALPFRVTTPPLLPARPDGLPAWLYLLGALAGAAVLTAGRLVGRVLVDDRVRLADSLVVDAELPVLAVIPDYRPVQAVGRVRWPIIGLVMLGVGTVTSGLAFLAAFG